jgi:hypothetical protein
VPYDVFIHRLTVCQGNGSHRSPTRVHVAGELSSLQDVCGWLRTRCQWREAAQVGALQPVESSVFVLVRVAKSTFDGAVLPS